MAAILAPVSRAQACACCAEAGDRIIATTLRDERIDDVLGDLRPAGKAHLRLGAGGFEEISGIADPAEEYTIGLRRDGAAWSLEFSGAGSGTLDFVLPGRLMAFAVDPTPTYGQRSTTLYKEWRLTMPVTGSGVFAAGLSGSPQANLILHGTGNACHMPDDFTHWTLEISGPGAKYTFFGVLLVSD